MAIATQAVGAVYYVGSLIERLSSTANGRRDLSRNLA
jgi:hypothetical protein